MDFLVFPTCSLHLHHWGAAALSVRGAAHCQGSATFAWEGRDLSVRSNPLLCPRRQVGDKKMLGMSEMMCTCVDGHNDTHTHSHTLWISGSTSSLGEDKGTTCGQWNRLHTQKHSLYINIMVNSRRTSGFNEGRNIRKSVNHHQYLCHRSRPSCVVYLLKSLLTN